MSDAPAAQVTENGAPPAMQEKEEAPGFKVAFFFVFRSIVLFNYLLRSSLEILRIPLRMKG